MADASSTVRPTKKQKQLLGFIEDFIAEHGYSPSYREIMTGLDYTSVATVAMHVSNLIRRGHLRKRDRSARSIEVLTSVKQTKVHTNSVSPDEERWLVEKVEHYVSEAEAASQVTATSLEDMAVLVAALRVLGLDGAAQSFQPRLLALRQHMASLETEVSNA